MDGWANILASLRVLLLLLTLPSRVITAIFVAPPTLGTIDLLVDPYPFRGYP